MGRAEVERRLFERRVETLEPRDEHQHRIRRDERRLADDGQEHPVVEESVIVGPEQRAEAVPEDQGRDPEHHPRHQDRRDHHRVVERTHGAAKLGQHHCAGEPDRHRKRDHAGADDQAVAEALHQPFVGDELAEPLEGEAFPRRDPREGRAVERRQAHQDERAEQVGEEGENIEAHHQAEDRARPHRPISPSLTLNRRIMNRTKAMQATSRMIA